MGQASSCGRCSWNNVDEKAGLDLSKEDSSSGDSETDQSQVSSQTKHSR